VITGRGQEQVESGYIDKPHPVLQRKQISPSSDHRERLNGSQRSLVGIFFAAQGDACGDEPGVREVDPVILFDLDIVAKNVFEEGKDFTVAIRPVDGDKRTRDSECRGGY
jgi:hypothetical protein